MIYRDFEIPIYSYKVRLLSLDTENVAHGCNKELEELGIVSEVRMAINEDCNDGVYDGAITIHLKGNQEIIAVFYPMYSEEKADECCLHELYHIVDDIAKATQIDNEAAAYLQGYVGQKMLKFRKLITIWNKDLNYDTN